MKLIRLRDVPELPPHRFRYDNSILFQQLMLLAWRDTATGRIVVDREAELLGWCGNIDATLMNNRQGQIGLLFDYPDYGDVWQHYPLFDDDERDAAVFQVFA